MKQLSLLLLMLAFACSAEDLPSISATPQSAQKKIGEWVMLQGTVDDVGQSEGGSVFLNFGGKHPNQILTVYIPPQIARMTRPESWQLYKGKKVQVDGVVKLHNDKPEIELKQMNFLRIVPQ